MFEGLIKAVVNVVRQFAGKAVAAGTPPEPTAPAISVETRIEAMYQAGIRDKVRQCAIREIVIHGTAGGSTMASLINWMLGGEQAANYNRGIGLFHYAIDRGGSITQVINPRYWVYHSLSGLHDQETVGIELLNPSRDNTDAYTDEQYKALVDLCDYLMKTNATCRQIVSHNHNGMTYSRIGKNCPGNFDWQRLSQSLAEKKWNIRTINREVLYVA
jgi:hypothetical protein